MTITLRESSQTGATTKGSALTWAELDGNFVHLDNATPISVKNYGAVGDGVTDDTAAFNLARTAALGGGVLYIVGTPLISSALTISSREHWVFAGAVGNSDGGYPGSYLVKAASLNADLVTIAAEGVRIEGGGILGEGNAQGAGGTGYTIAANGVVLRNPYVAKMKSHGIRVGSDAGTNANSFDVYHPVLIGNGGSGIFIDDGSNLGTITAGSFSAGSVYQILTVGTTDFTLIGASANTIGITFKATGAGVGTGTATQVGPNANAGLLVHPFAQSNGVDGIRLGRSFVNTIVNPTAELNTAGGLHVAAGSLQHKILGGDLAEANGTDLLIDDGATDILVFGAAYTTITDTGTNSRFFDKDNAGTIVAPFTPSLTFGGGSTGMTYGTRLGWKTRIGRYWQVEITIILTAKGSSTGIAQITGLPTSANISFNAGGVFSNVTNMQTLTGALMTQVATNTGIMNLYQLGATGQASLDEGDFTDTSNLQISVSYPAP